MGFLFLIFLALLVGLVLNELRPRGATYDSSPLKPKLKIPDPTKRSSLKKALSSPPRPLGRRAYSPMPPVNPSTSHEDDGAATDMLAAALAVAAVSDLLNSDPTPPVDLTPDFTPGGGEFGGAGANGEWDSGSCDSGGGSCD